MIIKNIISRYSCSKEAKNVGKNFFYLTLLQVGGYIFPLLTFPYLARVIGVVGFGKIAFASAIVGYVQTVTDWGFNYTTTRDIAKNRDNLQTVERIYSTVTCARVLLLILSAIVLGILLAVVPYLRENATIILISLLLMPGHVLFPEWLFQGMEDMKYITYLTFISKLIFTCLVFAFISTPDDYLIQPLLMAAGTFVTAIFGVIVVWKKWHIRIHHVPLRDAIKVIKDGTDLFINTLVPNFYNSFSVILLGFFGGSQSNGYYEGGNKFNTIISQFIQVLSRAFFPFLARRIDKHYLYVRISLLVALAASAMAFILAPWLVHTFLSNAFDESVTVLRILAVSIFFLSMTNVYGSNYLILVGEERTLRNATIFAAAIGLTLSFPLVYYFDYIGAAITIAFSRGVMGLTLYFRAMQVRAKLKSKV
jgi:PST family polysaccharide transporter